MSLVNQLSIEPNKSKQTKQEAVKLLIDAMSKDYSSTTWSEDDEFLLSAPNYKTKWGRDLHDQESKGLPSSERYELKHPGARRFLKELQ